MKSENLPCMSAKPVSPSSTAREGAAGRHEQTHCGRVVRFTRLGSAPLLKWAKFLNQIYPLSERGSKFIKALPTFPQPLRCRRGPPRRRPRASRRGRRDAPRDRRSNEVHELGERDAAVPAARARALEPAGVHQPRDRPRGGTRDPRRLARGEPGVGLPPSSV